MNDIEQPAAPQKPVQQKSNKKLIITLSIIGGLLGVGVIAGIIFLILPLLQSGSKQETKLPQTKPVAVQKALIIGNDKKPITYAGNQVIDACSLLSFDIIKAKAPNFTDALAYLGGDEKLTQPVVVRHTYTDRDIAQPLGNADKPRETTLTIGGDGINKELSASKFISIADSHCWYGQEESFSNKIIRLHVTQKPTPLSDDTLTYLASLKQKGSLISEVSGVEVYGDTLTGTTDPLLFIKKDATLVMVTAAIPELLSAVSDDIVNKLLSSPTGPMTATYPSVYHKLINPCQLFTAKNFEQVTKLPADSLAEELLYITESEKKTGNRSCLRYEVDRVKNGEISNIKITLRQSQDKESADAVMAYFKKGGKYENDTMTPVSKKGYGDESYIRKTGSGINTRYTMMMRVDDIIFELNYSNEEGAGKSQEEYEKRILPVAKIVLENFKSATK